MSFSYVIKVEGDIDPDATGIYYLSNPDTPLYLRDAGESFPHVGYYAEDGGYMLHPPTIVGGEWKKESEQAEGPAGTYTTVGEGVSGTAIIKAIPVIEGIAYDIAAAIDAITTGNGYELTLTAVRPRRLDFSGILLNDGKVFIWQGDHTAVGEPANLASEWLVEFDIGAFVIDSDDETDTIDARLNQVASDLMKKLQEDVTRRGCAEDTLFPRITKMDTEENTGVIVTAAVHYRTRIDDPYIKL